MTDNNFRNKVPENGIITIDLLDYMPTAKSVFFDLKAGLFMGLILKEKEFKSFLSSLDFQQYANKSVAIGCSEDAIIPTWAYMAIAEKLTGIASCMDFNTPENLDLQRWKDNIVHTDFSYLQGMKVVVRQYKNIDPALYVLMTNKLKPLVKTLMYGEAGLPKVIFKKQEQQ